LAVSGSIPEVGEHIVVIGTPFGLERTVSDGIVSAVRQIPGFGKVYQVTAPISPGSSGSPVVNMKGEVIGIATFQFVQGQNLNFAIPAERISKLKKEKGKTLNEWKTGQLQEWSDSTDEVYKAGLSSLGAGDYEKALFYFENVVKKNPRDALAYGYIAACNSGLGRYIEAIEAYKQAIRLRPDLPWAYYNLGVVCGNMRRYMEAIDAYKQAIRIKPDLAEAHYSLGMVYGDLRHYMEAIDAYKQAIRIKPDYAEAHLNLGLTYLIIQDRGSALDQYNILKNLDNSLASRLFNMIYK
jgi:tetratricopeptide (TPR) repeat protein